MKRMRILSMVVGLFSCLLFSSEAYATTIRIANFGPAGKDSTAKTMTFRLDFVWVNSWNTSTNHDAVWIFMKYFIPDQGIWHHAKMSASGINPSGFSAKGFEIIVPEDRTGFFFRMAPGQSNESYSVDTTNSGLGSVTFTWDYSSAAVNDHLDVENTSIKFRIFAIEMVYIPEGSFIAGDYTSSYGNASSYSFRYGLASTANPPSFLSATGWPINSESPIQTGYVGAGIGPGTGPYYYYTTGPGSYDAATGQAFVIPSEYPKGYKPFYLMKYEISQGQYRDYLNTLSEIEGRNRCSAGTTGQYCASTAGTASPTNRQGIRFVSSTAAAHGGYNYACALSSATGVDGWDDGEWVAAGFLSWIDIASYLDWAALRPMTDLEYEKAARGPVTPYPTEYPWGNFSVDQSPASTYTALNSSAETPDRGVYQYGASAGTMPIRVGAYARSTNVRTTAGAGYYGNLDLAGNMWETVIDVGGEAGRSFQGSHGDGFLSTDSQGYGTNNDWPGWSAGVISTISSGGGVMYKGGSFADTDTYYFRTSNREYAGVCGPAYCGTRDKSYGGRGARTAPTFAEPTKPQ